MSISALTSEAARLLQVFQTKETSINAAVNAAVAAVPLQVKNYYVDAINGSDSNAGTSAAPFLTLNQALTMINGVSGLSATIWLAPGDAGSTYTFDRNAILSNSCVIFRSSGSGSIKPIIQMQYLEIQYNDNPTNGNYGFTLCLNFELSVIGCHIKAPVIPEGAVGYDLYPHRGLVQNDNGGKFRVVSCELTLDVLPLARFTGAINALWVNACTINSPEGSVLLELGNTPVIFHAAFLTLATSGATLADLVTGRTYSSEGYPLNLLSNHDFAGV
jgi:hypothetical protein